jgi:tetratricopeptide (TPR) repeat protein
VAHTHTDFGRIYLAYNYPKRAEKLWRRAAELDVKNRWCLQDLAALCRKTGRSSEALGLYERIRDIDPTNAVGQHQLGTMYQQLRRFADAETCFRKVVELAPERQEGHRALAQLFLQTGQNLAAVRQVATKIADLEPTARNFFFLGQACERNGDRDACLAALKRAAELEPDNPQYRRAYETVKDRE